MIAGYVLMLAKKICILDLYSGRDVSELNQKDERKPIYSVFENDETWLNHPLVTYSPTSNSRKDLMLPRDKLTANISHTHDQVIWSSATDTQTLQRCSRVCTERRRLLNSSLYCPCPKWIGPWHLGANVSKCYKSSFSVSFPYPLDNSMKREAWQQIYDS